MSETSPNNLKKWYHDAALDQPQWLLDFQKERLVRFDSLGIPTVKDEEWKYTSLSNFAKESFIVSLSEGRAPQSFKNTLSDEDTNIVFVNSGLDKNLSNFHSEDGVEIKTLDQMIRDDPTELQTFLSKYDKGEETAFMTLNSGLMTNGIFIKAAKNVVSKKLINIFYLSTRTEEGSVANNVRTIVNLEKSSEITLVEHYLSWDQGLKYFTNTVTDIFIDENATMHYIKAQKESESSYHVSNTRVQVGRNANFKGFTLTTQSGFTRNNLDIVLNGEGSDGTLSSLYSVFNNQHVDNHTSVDHRVPNCTSNQLYKGLLNDNARAVFNGKVFVRAIAQQTNSYQLNQNLLFGKKVRIDTKPQLEIFADDVKCTHGATVGHLNEEEIFYLQTRNIARWEAIRIMVRGFAEETLATIGHKKIEQRLLTLLETSFDSFKQDS